MRCRDDFMGGLGAKVSALLLLLILPLASAAAEPETITVGKFKVHPSRIIAKYSARADQLQGAATLRNAGLAVQHWFKLVPGLVVLDADPRFALKNAADLTEEEQSLRLVTRLEALRNSGLFEYVEPSYLVHSYLVPNDSAFVNNTLWGLRNRGTAGGVVGADIAAEQAWDITTGSSGVVVAVIDTGVRYTHRDLARQMWRNPGEIPGNQIDDDGDGYVDNVFGINAITRSGDPMDDNDHGTHVAGTIGAAANDGNPAVGVAWNVQIMACKFLDEFGFGFTDDAIRCIDFAVANGARVLNNSWGGGGFSRPLFDSLSAARRQGVLVVVAAGNESNNNDAFPDYPASFQIDNIISVAALDRRDQLAGFSNFGATNVHLGAPGVEIYSTASRTDSEYRFLDGTSMAAPHVSGVAALILSRYPNASVAEMRERLLTTTVPIPSLSGKTRTGGRLNAFNALSAQPDGTLEVTVFPPSGAELRSGLTNNFFVSVTDISSVTNATVTVTLLETGQTSTLRNNGAPPDDFANDETYSAPIALPSILGALRAQVSVTAPGKASRTLLLTYSLIAPPVNDHFASALKVSAEGGLIQATNKLATMEPGEPRHAKVPTASASVWWNWSPSRSGKVIIDTAGSSFDTVLAVYTNSTLQTLKEVASADDYVANGRLRSQQGHVVFDATAGISYRIAVSGYSENEQGTIRLRVEPGGAPDTRPPTVVITSPQSGTVVTEAGADRVAVSGTATDSSPNASGVKEVLVTINGQIANVAMGTTNWVSTNLMQIGPNTVRVIAADFAGNRSEERIITVHYRPVLTPNDIFHNAIEIFGSQGRVEVNSSAATKEFGEPAHGGNMGGKSVWWYFIPPTDGVLSLNTTNSTFDTLLGMYVGGRVSQLTLVEQNDDAVEGSTFSKLTQAVRGDEVYWIAVDGFDGQGGLATLEYSFVSGPVFAVDLQSTEGGIVEPRSKLFPEGANITVIATPAANFEFDHWDGTFFSQQNPLPLSVTRDISLTAHFRPYQFTDDFETGSFNKLGWTTDGSAPWAVARDVVAAGSFAATSGVIGNGQHSSLKLRQVCRAGLGAFDLKVSSEQGWDFLEFYLNGKRIERWSGEVGWLRFQFQVNQGTNHFEWRYTKDISNTSEGLDAAFIDNLDLPFLAPVNETTPAQISILSRNLGLLQLQITGQDNQRYVIEMSDNLRRWTPISTNLPTRGVIQFTDPFSPSATARFYRAIVP